MNEKTNAGRFLALLGTALALGALFLLGMASSTAPSPARGQPLAPVPEPIRACWWGRMCSQIVSGTYQSVWIITGKPGSLSGIGDYRTPNFSQRVLSRTDTSVRVRVTSKAVLNTEAPFPLPMASLPARVHVYLQPTEKQQSDHPLIVQQAQTLVQGAALEAQAVVAVLDWVRANISYDYSFSLPRDALSVYENRSGVCAGFSNLAVALLRAVGIPARVVSGCALWSQPHGGGHAWIEIYYPDVGWVPTEPQKEQNFVSPNRLVDPTWWDWCGEDATAVAETWHKEGEKLYLPTTAYADSIWGLVYSAVVPAWDRHPARVDLPRLSVMAAPEEQTITPLEVESNHCYSTTWQLRSSVPWIQLSPSSGAKRTRVSVALRAEALPLGVHTAVITMTTPFGRGNYYSASRAIPVEVRVVRRVHRLHLPLLTRAIAN